jgi:hypothetical protein
MPLLRVSAQCFGARVNHLNGGQRCVRAPPRVARHGCRDVIGITKEDHHGRILHAQHPSSPR